MEQIIKIENLNKKYKTGYGIFDINFEVRKGEVYGYLGPNGAGKSTTIRHIMGYIKPQTGNVSIFGNDAWTESHLIQPKVGYVAGEIAFPEFMNGLEFIKQIYDLRKQDNWDYVEELIEYWQFDPNMKIKRMSKGMKQKVALVIAFMHNPELIILDEPTTGLDPLMQEKFIDLVLKEKRKGTTFVVSTHIFTEVEKTCDRVAIIKSGRIISDVNLNELAEGTDRHYHISFDGKAMDSKYRMNTSSRSVHYVVPPAEVEQFFAELKKYNVKTFKEKPFSLEEYFLHFYKKDKDDKVMQAVEKKGGKK